MRTEGVIIDTSKEKPELIASVQDLHKLLQTIEDEILPKTKEGVQKGNKVFGAAVLDSDLNLIIADTNDETTCPLFHGEVKLIYEWSKVVKASERGPAAQESIFLSTHEPCCMCISSIVWSGFRKVFYLFPYSITSAQGIPHDINVMHELWGVNSYRKKNRYCSTACIMDLIEGLEESDDKNALLEKQQELVEAYERLSNKYHTEKKDNLNNSLVLG